jgi:hypothetical protein
VNHGSNQRLAINGHGDAATIYEGKRMQHTHTLPDAIGHHHGLSSLRTSRAPQFTGRYAPLQ